MNINLRIAERVVLLFVVFLLLFMLSISCMFTSSIHYTKIYEYKINYDVAPSDDKAFAEWLLLQPNVVSVHTHRSKQSVVVLLIIGQNIWFKEDLPNILSWLHSNGYIGARIVD